MLSYEQAVAKIKENSNLSEEEISSNINVKLDQFAGLVSKEGAAHILANEMGIKLITKAASEKLKISNIVVGMQSVEVLTKVLAIYAAKQFNTNGRSGQVGSLLLGDETGVVRSVFWNDQANKLAFINKGDIVKLNGVYAKENRNQKAELHVNAKSLVVVNPPGETVEVKEFTSEVKRKRLNELADNDDRVEVLGTVIEVFDMRFFEVCDKCGKRARPENNTFNCAQHGSVTPNYSYVLNVFLDDGTAAVRTVFFRNMAQQLLKKTEEEILKFREAPELFEQVKNDALGSFLKINARVNKNEMFNRIELIANEVSEAKPEEAQAAAPTQTDTKLTPATTESTTPTPATAESTQPTPTATTPEQTTPSIEPEQVTNTDSKPSVK